MMGGIESCLGVFADVINTLGLVRTDGGRERDGRERERDGKGERGGRNQSRDEYMQSRIDLPIHFSPFFPFLYTSNLPFPLCMLCPHSILSLFVNLFLSYVPSIVD